jgi:ABC-type transport system substrate-binding protein
VEITLTQPDSAFLIVLCNFSGLGILPRHILGEVPPEQLEAHSFSMAPTVTAGAYTFVRFESDQYLEVERNPNYFGGAPDVERLFLKILTPEVGQTQLETGDLDLMTLAISEAERVRGIEGVTVVNVPSPSMDFIVFNLERPYLQNQQMRIAMTHAIDREGIAASVFQGEATVVNSPIFGPEWMGVPEGLDPHPYDPDLARQLLAESGFDTSQTLELIHYNARSPEQNAALVVIQEQLREVGFQIEIIQVDIAELIRRVVQENDFDLFYEGGGVFRADPNISAGYLLTRNFAPDGGNVTHYSNPRVDELYAQGQAAPTLEERRAIYTEVAQILNEEAPWVFLWSPNSLFAVSDRLQGFVAPSYTDNKFWNAETWSVSG